MEIRKEVLELSPDYSLRMVKSEKEIEGKTHNFTSDLELIINEHLRACLSALVWRIPELIRKNS